jgi:hypothetical protein
MSVDQAREAEVVSVNGVSLDGATLEQLLLSNPAQVQPSREAASVYVSAFVDAALLRRALLRGIPLTDSAMVASAIAPDAVRGQILQILQDRETNMAVVTDAQADSLARLGAVRIFQHILLRVQDQTDSASVQAALDRMDGVLQQLRDGAEFGELARRASEDSSTAPGDGYLPPLRRAELPPQGRFAATVWALQPGEISQVVRSGAGFHLVRRASVAEARPGLKGWLGPRLARHADSVWADSLLQARNLEVDDAAATRLRALSIEPYSGGGDQPFATWDGGDLSAAEMRTWVAVLPATERATLPISSDSANNLLIKQIAERELVWEASRPGTPRVTPEAWEALAPQYRQIVAALTEQYRDALVVGDSNTALRRFVSDITTGALPYRPLPGALGAVLRDEAIVTINENALERIVGSASEQWQTRNDSAAVSADSQ